MKLDSFLRAHAFLEVERPQQLWEIALAPEQDKRFVQLLGEMISLGTQHGCALDELALNVSNVVVRDTYATGPPMGEFVALTLSGAGPWGAEASLRLPLDSTAQPPDQLAPVLEAASAVGAPFLYLRDLGELGAVTVYLPRLVRGKKG